MSAHALAASLRILNILDALFTVFGVATLGVEEANPLWAPVLRFSPFAFLFLKILVVGLLAEFLARRDRRAVLAVANVVYVAALAAHARCFFA